MLILNAELGKLCPFSAPRGHTFSTCPPRFPPRARSNSMAFVTSQLETLGMIEQPV